MDRIGTQRLKTILLLAVAVLLLAIAIWFGRGRLPAGTRYLSLPSETPATPEKQVVDIFRKAAQGTGAGTARENCIRERLGVERYAVISLRPGASTPEDQFKILPCYQ